MATTTHLLTYEDLLRTPDDGQRYEIIAGKLFVLPSPLLKHQKVSGHLFGQLFNLEKAGLGEVFYAPTDVKLSEHDWVVPDLLFIRRERVDVLCADRRFVDGPPDLIIEILSPSTRSRDLGDKEALYAAAGVQEYWWVDGDREDVRASELVNGRYVPIPVEDGRIRSRVVPAFVVDVAALFAGLR